MSATTVGAMNEVEDAKARFLTRHPVPLLSSYAIVLLRKPHGGPTSRPPLQPRSSVIVGAQHHLRGEQPRVQ
jgi:hypothetical protein